MNLALLSVFIPTILFISITPGMCMTLALSLGMSIGYRKTLWMMLGEVIGVGIVAITAVLGVSSVMLNYPWLFTGLKIVGALYLFYLGVSMWRSKGRLALSDSPENINTNANWNLITQGFLTAIANPKGWAFMVSLLPPFIDINKSMTQQLMVIVGIIMVSEFLCMSLYATGGKALKRVLGHSENVRLINRISGSLMVGVGVWLLMS
ncbi:LysE family translocator [Sessilibacter sp. MAH1]